MCSEKVEEPRKKNDKKNTSNEQKRNKKKNKKAGETNAYDLTFVNHLLNTALHCKSLQYSNGTVACEIAWYSAVQYRTVCTVGSPRVVRSSVIRGRVEISRITRRRKQIFFES